MSFIFACVLLKKTLQVPGHAGDTLTEIRSGLTVTFLDAVLLRDACRDLSGISGGRCMLSH